MRLFNNLLDERSCRIFTLITQKQENPRSQHIERDKSMCLCVLPVMPQQFLLQLCFWMYSLHSYFEPFKMTNYPN